MYADNRTGNDATMTIVTAGFCIGKYAEREVVRVLPSEVEGGLERFGKVACRTQCSADYLTVRQVFPSLEG